MSTKIYFKYGAMNSGKSLELIKIAYNYQENNINALVLKPEIDTRAQGEIYSRAGLRWPAVEIDNDIQSVLKVLGSFDHEIILIEESNFLSKDVIDTIVNFAYENNVTAVIFFGLKVDFRGELFEGSKRIMELCDKMEESTSICWCGRKARQNARVVNGEITKSGPTILVDDDQTKVEYITLCNYHYHHGMLSEK